MKSLSPPPLAHQSPPALQSPPAFQSPILEPAYGSSRSTGGIFRGGRDKFSWSDTKDAEEDDLLALPARVFLYSTPYGPNTVNPATHSKISLAVTPFNYWAQVLPQTAQSQPMVKGIYFIFTVGVIIDIICLEPKSGRGYDQVLYVLDSVTRTDWLAIGSYALAISNQNTEVYWKEEDGYIAANLLVVSQI